METTIREDAKFYKIDKAAIECGVDKSTIKAAIRNGRLKATQVPSNRGRYPYTWLINEDDLAYWLENVYSKQRAHKRKRNEIETAKTEKFVSDRYKGMEIDDISKQFKNRVLDVVMEAIEEMDLDMTSGEILSRIQESYLAGRNEGFEDGKKHGYDDGYSAGIEEGKRLMKLQIEEALK